MSDTSLDFSQIVSDLFDFDFRKIKTFKYEDLANDRKIKKKQRVSLSDADTKRINSNEAKGELAYITGFFQLLRKEFDALPVEKYNTFDQNIGYQFAGKELVDKFKTADESSEKPPNKEVCYINESLDVLRKFVTDCIDLCKMNERFVFSITGKMGIGKSIIVKAIDRGFEKLFNDNKVVFCPIRYAELKKHLQETSSRDFDSHTIKVVKKQIAIKLMSSTIASSSKKLGAIGKNISGKPATLLQILKDRIRQDISQNYDYQRELLKTYRSPNEAIESLCMLFENLSFESDSLSTNMLTWPDCLIQMILSAFRSCKYKYIVCFDGFDAFNAYDIKYTRGGNITYRLYNLAFENDSYNYIFTLRDCTYKQLNNRVNNKVEVHHHDFYRMAPVPLDNLINKTINFHIKYNRAQAKWYIKDIPKFMNYVIKKLSLELEFGDNKKSDKITDVMVEVFNRNYRRLFTFLENCMIISAEHLLDKAYARDFGKIIEDIDKIDTDDEHNILETRKYEYTEVLLCGDKLGFKNFHSKNDIAKKNLMSNSSTYKSGSVDNIFYYEDITYGTENTTFFLIKIRIIQYLLTYNYSTEEEIRKGLEVLGYKINKRDLEKLLNVMIQSEFVKVSMLDDDIKYNCSKFGLFTVRSLLEKVVYIERTTPQSLVPKAYSEMYEILEKSKCKISEWIEASLKNNLLTLILINQIEAYEKMNMQGFSEVRKRQWNFDYEIYDKCRMSHKDIFDRIFSSKSGLPNDRKKSILNNVHKMIYDEEIPFEQMVLEGLS